MSFLLTVVRDCFITIASIVVEFAKESRPRRDVYESERGYGYSPLNYYPGVYT